MPVKSGRLKAGADRWRDTLGIFVLLVVLWRIGSVRNAIACTDWAVA